MNQVNLATFDKIKLLITIELVQNGFDDLLIWASNNVLMNRMVSVGKLP